jgi:hypothetical protein
MSDLDISKPNGAITEIVPVVDSGVVLMPVMNIQAAKKRLAEFQEFVREYLVPEEDYGTIPGTPKPTLFKSGADKLCELYGLADDFTIESRVEDYTADPPLFDYTIKCTLTNRRDGRLVGTGVGACTSWEGKYRWRESRRKCPLCGKEAIIKGKEEWGGGWVCFKKKEGCGAKFVDGDKAIEEQKAGKEVNDDICTLKNTILKMAKKRAKVDAVIAVTRSSGIFTQDMDDIVEHDTSNGSGTRASAQRVAEKKTAELKEKKASNHIPALFYTWYNESQTARIEGDHALMEKHRDLLVRFWEPSVKAVVCNAEQLENLKFALGERSVPFKLLKTIGEDLQGKLKESIAAVAAKKAVVKP